MRTNGNVAAGPSQEEWRDGLQKGETEEVLYFKQVSDVLEIRTIET